MQREVIIELAKGAKTEAEVKAALAPRSKLSFHVEVAARTAVSKALRTLKHEHRVYPIKGKWHLTKRGGKR